jgi:hypothetical protein
MATTYTTTKKLLKPGNNDFVDTWDVPVNTDWDYIDTAFGGVTSINGSGQLATTYVLAEAEYRPGIILITGAITANLTYQFPSSIGGRWVVKNGTTGAYTVTFTSAGAGASAAITQGNTTTIYCDATNVYLTISTSNVSFTNAALTTPTLTSATVTGYTESVVAIGTVTSTSTISLTNGTVQTATLTASTACTFTMPSVSPAGRSFILMLKQDASTGAGTATFTGVHWPANTAPTVTATAGTMDIFTFVSNGTNWYGTASQNYNA